VIAMTASRDLGGRDLDECPSNRESVPPGQSSMRAPKNYMDLRGLEVRGQCVVKFTTALPQSITTRRYNWNTFYYLCISDRD